MRIALTGLLLFLSLAVNASESKLIPFETDYCTNYREGTSSNPYQWKHCCLIHDMYFWAGGSKQDRYNADLELKTCIEKTGAFNHARLMFLAVRAGSYAPIKYSKKKWNHGWKGRGNYAALSSEDIDRVEAELFGGYEHVSNEIKIYFINSLRSRLD